MCGTSTFSADVRALFQVVVLSKPYHHHQPSAAEYQQEYKLENDELFF